MKFNWTKSVYEYLNFTELIKIYWNKAQQEFCIQCQWCQATLIWQHGIFISTSRSENSHFVFFTLGAFNIFNLDSIRHDHMCLCNVYSVTRLEYLTEWMIKTLKEKILNGSEEEKSEDFLLLWIELVSFQNCSIKYFH